MNFDQKIQKRQNEKAKKWVTSENHEKQITFAKRYLQAKRDYLEAWETQKLKRG